MKTMVEEFGTVARTIAFRQPRLPIVSDITGQLADERIATAEHWSRHVLATVQFAAGMEALHRSGCRVFLELGPKPSLIGMGQRAIATAGTTWVPSLQKHRSGWDSMLDAAAALFVAGTPVDWTAFDAGCGRRRIELPTYPFERQRFWIDETAATPSRTAASRSIPCSADGW